MRAYAMKAAEVVGRSRRSLGLPDRDDAVVDVTLVGALLRRAAGIYCPCSRATLRAAALDSLRYCDVDQDRLTDVVETSIDALLAVGDLLELSDVTASDFPATGTWVFGAPPAYIIRPSGTLYLVGVVADQESLLPPTLNERVVYNGVVREIAPQVGEDLTVALRELGLMELSEASWLKPPKPVDAADLVRRVRSAVESQPLNPPVTGLQILDSTRPVNYYRGRWVNAFKHTGLFVARRPQEFGSPLWCCVELFADGAAKVLDLPFGRWRWRGCDAAWHIQMAMDACLGSPQNYKCEKTAEGIEFTFFSPLPQWAERRFMIFGQYLESSRGLFTYRVPESESATEQKFLENQLFLTAILD